MKKVVFYRVLLSQVSQNSITYVQQDFKGVTRLCHVFLRHSPITYVQQGFKGVTRLCHVYRFVPAVTRLASAVTRLASAVTRLIFYPSRLKAALCNGCAMCDTCATKFPNIKGKVLIFWKMETRI
jgi:hypothetical protein